MPFQYAHGYLFPPEPLVVTLVPGTGNFSDFGSTASTVDYVITITNNGGASATPTPVITLPPELAILTSTPSQGTFDGTTWIVGTLAPAASATLSINTQATIPISAPAELSLEMESANISYQVQTDSQLAPPPGQTAKFNFQAENVAGYTLAATEVEFTFQPTDGIQIELPTSARTAGTLFYRYHATVHFGSDPAEAYRIALWESYNDDGSNRTLNPITLTEDSHLVDPSIGVANPAALPTGTNRISGTTRLVTSLGAYYFYNPLESRPVDGTIVITDGSGGTWTRTGGSPFLGALTDPYSTDGCAQMVQLVDPEIVTRILYYEPNPDLPTESERGVGFYYYAEETIPKGTAFRFTLWHNDIPNSDAFRQMLLIRFQGYVDITDGTLDVDNPDSPTGQMALIGEDIIWNPIEQQIILDKDLPAGQAAYWLVFPYFSIQQSLGRILAGDRIYISGEFTFLAGERAEALWQLTGDAIFGVADRMRVLPDGTIGSGHGIIQKYTFPLQNLRTLPSFIPNTTSNTVRIDGDGNISVELDGVSLEPRQAIRAFVNLEEGTSAVLYSPTASITSGAIQVSLTYPWDTDEEKAIIRLDYPFIGGMLAELTYKYLRVWVLAGANIYQQSDFTIVAGETQTLLVTSLGTPVGSIPNPSSFFFSCFDPPASTISDTSGGTVPAGTYRVAVGYYLDGGDISFIDHDPANGCIRELAENPLGDNSSDDAFLYSLLFGRKVYLMA